MRILNTAERHVTVSAEDIMLSTTSFLYDTCYRQDEKSTVEEQEDEGKQRNDDPHGTTQIHEHKKAIDKCGE